MAMLDDESATGEPPARPAPWRPPAERAQAATIGRLRPWIDWFGAGRLLGAAVTVVLAVGIGWWLLRPADVPTEATLPYASAPAVASPPPATVPPPPTTAAKMVVVHVAGAVVTAGVYELPAGGRVVDAVAAAGGAAPEADVGALNLAAVVADGERLYVPRVGEPVPAVVGPASPPASSPPAGPLDLNAAGATELDRLPGIGPATAQAIVEHREQHGPFAAVDDLEEVRGIGPAKLEALRDQVTT